ncbi:MAG TPA: GNAT family N-acetyltransferase [Candidatus Xenobia bacterium]|jgi:GNAT superfamily N-acetyltransferase
MSIRPYQPSTDVDAVVALWNVCFPVPFHLGRRLFEQNTTGDPHFDENGAFVLDIDGHVRGYLGCKKARAPLGSLGLLPDRGWISVLFVHPSVRRQGHGKALMAAGRRWIEGRQLYLGGDPAHFFPGVPDGFESALRFFAAEGFRFGDGKAWDLRQDIRAWQPPRDVEALEAQAGVSIGSCQSSWTADLLEFFDREFPGRWKHDTRRRLALEPGPEDVVVARTDDGRIEGFSSTWQPASRTLGPSVYWLGSACGGLGPIGVSSSMRGKGLGLALVYRSTMHVKANGAEHMGVDWTVLLDFYRKAGFEPWLCYRLAAPAGG